MPVSRQESDMNDTILILKALADGKSLFIQKQDTLKNIITAVHADDSVEVDTARTKVKKITATMTGKSVMTYSLKQTDQCIMLATKSLVRTKGREYKQIHSSCSRGWLFFA